jgi:hypothetical protein
VGGAPEIAVAVDVSPSDDGRLSAADPRSSRWRNKSTGRNLARAPRIKQVGQKLHSASWIR